MGDGIGGFAERKPRRGITFGRYINKTTNINELSKSKAQRGMHAKMYFE